MKTAEHYKVGEIVKDWIEDGVRCLIMRGPASFCAYLGVPTAHPLAGFDYDSLPLDCHGGLTFAAKGNGKNHPDDWYWYGWDYAHAGDRTTYDLPRFSTERDWFDEEVEKEVELVLYDFKRLVRLAEKITIKPKA